MEIGIGKTNYNHVQIIITKIVMLARLLKVSTGDVVLYTMNTRVKFIVFVACFLANKSLHIVNKMTEFDTITLTEKIGTILTDPELQYASLLGALHQNNLDVNITLDSKFLFDNSKTFGFIRFRAVKVVHAKEYDSIYWSSFKDERKAFIDHLLTPGYGQGSLLNIIKKGNVLRYSKHNIATMVEAIGSEFGEESRKHVSLLNTKFEDTFAYMLYFFLRGDLLDVVSNNSTIWNIRLGSSHRMKILHFTDENSFQKDWHRTYKYKYYSRLNNFLRRWKLTNWITKYTYSKILMGSIRDKHYELVLFNHNRSLDKSKFLDQAHTRVSTIFGTSADGYTLSINRYDDKKLKIVNNSFRIMGSTIKVEKDNLNRLFVGGKRIPHDMKTKHAILVKDPKDQYYLDGHYCDIKGEILTINADQEDIYFDKEGNTTVDVGTRIRSLMAVPFVKRVNVFKYQDEFVGIVELDLEFIKQTFETPTFTNAYERLKEKVKELNSYVSDPERISDIIVSKEFFKVYDSISHIITKRNFIKYLNQQPFNYFQALSRREEASK